MSGASDSVLQGQLAVASKQTVAMQQATRSAQGCLETTESERIPGISTCVASSALADVDDRHDSGCRGVTS